MEYSTHFLEIQKAKEQLTSLARGFADGSLRFGNPVTDFLVGEPTANNSPEATNQELASQDDRGLFDHLIDLNDGYNKIAAIAEGMTEDLNVLHKSLQDASEEIDRIGANQSASTPAAMRKVLRRLAERVEKFRSQLRSGNDEYSRVAQDTENSLEFVVAFQYENSELAVSDIAQREEFMSSLRALRETAIEGRDALVELASLLQSLPRLERRLNRELEQTREEILETSSNLERTIASISRVLARFA